MTETTGIGNYLGFQTVTGCELVERVKQHVLHFPVPIYQGDRAKEQARRTPSSGYAAKAGPSFAGAR